MKREDTTAFTNVATLFARAYLRLTEKARNDDVSRPGEPQKQLDVSATESAHVNDETDHEGPPWKVA